VQLFELTGRRWKELDRGALLRVQNRKDHSENHQNDKRDSQICQAVSRSENSEPSIDAGRFSTGMNLDYKREHENRLFSLLVAHRQNRCSESCRLKDNAFARQPFSEEITDAPLVFRHFLIWPNRFCQLLISLRNLAASHRIAMSQELELVCRLLLQLFRRFAANLPRQSKVSRLFFCFSQAVQCAVHDFNNSLSFAAFDKVFQGASVKIL
jgi:hypothetical protein